MKAVKKILDNERVHLEACKGSERQNDEYCQKDGDYMTFGTFKTQGQRTDLENVKKMIDNGEAMVDVAEQHFETFMRYHKGFYKYKELKAQKEAKKFRKLNVTVLCGKTGTGKTRAAIRNADDDDYYKIQGDDMKWFDGYEGEKTLIIDEYDSSISLTKLLGILDGYILRLPIKGGHTYALWENVIITSNIHPDNWHPNAKEEHKAALNRRITEVKVYE